MKSLLPPPPMRRKLRLQADGQRSLISSHKDASIAHSYSTIIRRPTSLFPPRSQIAITPVRRPQRRTFINIPNLFPNNGKNNTNGNDNECRTLRATRTLPFPPAPLFDIIASVESYSDFLPFLATSTVTARDPVTDNPTQAFLTVGYGPFSETFTSRVYCDRSRWTVEARSGGGVGDDGNPVPGGDEGLFSHLSTKWELIPRAGGNGRKDETEVTLEIRFRFQNPLHTAMMGAVEHKVAGVMIEAFEKRIKEKMALEA